MNECSQCGKPREKLESRCPYCGGLNSKIDDILSREAEEAEKNTFTGTIKTIFQAKDKKKELFSLIKTIKQSQTKESLFTLFVIFVFIFFMTYVAI